MKKIKLTKGKYALVDDEDFEWLNQWKWYAGVTGTGNIYAERTTMVNGKKIKIRMHRLIMNCPINKVVDHIKHNTLDNRKKHLRICTHRENSLNTKNKRQNNGIYKHKNLYYFKMSISQHGFKKKSDAIKKYKYILNILNKIIK